MADSDPHAVSLAVEPPGSADARLCREAYFAELADRFDGGFDPSMGGRTRDEGMIAPAGIFLVARKDGVAVGCGGFVRLSSGVAEVKRMWTAREARGLGIARRILRDLEGRAAEAGYGTVRLDTNRTLTEAQAFYRSAGYAEVARYNDNPYADLWFEKRLDREIA